MALVGQQGRVRSHGDSLAAIAVTTEMPDCRLTIFPRPGTLHFYGEVADRRAAGIGGAFEIGARLGAQLVLLQLFVDRRENSAPVPHTGRHIHLPPRRIAHDPGAEGRVWVTHLYVIMYGAGKRLAA